MQKRDNIMNTITDDMKRQIDVNVKLYYHYGPRANSDLSEKLRQIGKILKTHNLNSKISEGYNLGHYETLCCEGIVNLYEADLILKEFDDADVFGKIEYHNGQFYLQSFNSLK